MLKTDAPSAAVRVLTLDRPERRNALSTALQADLVEELLRCAESGDVRAIVLTGNGPAFCAGFDLKEIREGDRRGERFRPPMNRPTRSLFEVVTETPVPIVAAVNGAAVAGGAGLVSVCDLAVAVPEARFGYPEVRRGLVAAMVMPHLLRHVGERAARWLLLTGEPIDAGRAAVVGLVNRVVDEGGALEATVELATAIAANGPLAVAITKEIALSAPGWPGEERWARQDALARRAFKSEDAVEGAAAFAERRPPQWRGR